MSLDKILDDLIRVRDELKKYYDSLNDVDKARYGTRIWLIGIQLERIIDRLSEIS